MHCTSKAASRVSQAISVSCESGYFRVRVKLVIRLFSKFDLAEAVRLVFKPVGL